MLPPASLSVLQRCLFLVLFGSSASLQAGLSAPDSAPAGSSIEVTWSDPEAGGRIRFLDKSGETWQGAPYAYLRQGKAALRVPAKPGEYQIGYQPEREVTTTVPIEITPVTATLEVPESVGINETFEVPWTGPAYQQDRIRVIRSDGSPLPGGSYVYPANTKNSLAKLKAPVESGDYLVVYRMQDETLAKRPLQVGGAEASLKLPPTVPAGGDLEVFWTGPDNDQDTIALIPVGSSSRSTAVSYAYTGNSTAGGVRLVAPEKTGHYEAAYFTGGKILAREAVEVVPVTASLEAPDEVTAGLHFEVTWTGPGNRQDRIEMVPSGATDVAPSVVAYVAPPENVVTPAAAVDPGEYELRYRTGGGAILASRPIQVLPAPVDPGSLRVKRKPGALVGENSAVEIILDASGSMLKRQGERRRIDIARETLLALIDDTLPSGVPFALRVFGHREAGSCRTDLEIPLGPLDPEVARTKIAAIQAINGAKTPLAASLAAVSEDLPGITGERVIILVTDGEETCGGDPVLAIQSLRESGIDLRVNIIGYSIDDEGLRETFESWAALGNGLYLDAPGAEELDQALRRALDLPYRIFSGEKVVARGLTGREVLELPPGNYTLRFRRGGEAESRDLTIRSGQLTELSL